MHYLLDPIVAQQIVMRTETVGYGNEGFGEGGFLLFGEQDVRPLADCQLCEEGCEKMLILLKEGSKILVGLGFSRLVLCLLLLEGL
jgi:hypothetical protein